MRSAAGAQRSAARLILADVYRITGRTSWWDVVVQFLVGEAFRYNVVLRLAGSTRRNSFWQAILRMWLRRLRQKLGVNIPYSTTVGPGLLIGHTGGIVVNAGVIIGANCNLSHGVTIGVSRGRNPGVPTIGDRVYIGPGAVLIGAIEIGDDAAIGANAVVTQDVPAGMTAVGNPAQCHAGGSAAYVNRVVREPTR